jgi:hypothetical protein
VPICPGAPRTAWRAAAEALIRAFPGHFECRAPGDEACLGRLRATGRTCSNPLCDLVRDKVIAPEDALPVGLTILAALAALARTSAFSRTGRFRVTPHLRPASPAA